MYKVVELFSGIGSQARALQNLKVEYECAGTCEWDIHAIAAYDLLQNADPVIPDEIMQLTKAQLLERLKDLTLSNTGKEPLEYRALSTYSLNVLRRIAASIQRNRNFIDISSLTGDRMPEGVDILTYSFPCQDLSNVGAFHGYMKGIDPGSNSRSSLLWQVGRILNEMAGAGKSLPRFLLMENVPALLNRRHQTNFIEWVRTLQRLGYDSCWYPLNASDFGLPQNRPRLLMISVLVGEDETARRAFCNYAYCNKTEDVISAYCSSEFYRCATVRDLLRTDYSREDLLAEAVECTPKDTVSRRKIWEENPRIVLEDGTVNPEVDVIRTITTKQDRNPNSGNLYFDLGGEGSSRFRYLTPRECLLFMGFTDRDYEILRDHNEEYHRGDQLFARDKIIRLAGNSIPVKLLEGIFLQILYIDELFRRIDEFRAGEEAFRDRAGNAARTLSSALFRLGVRIRRPAADLSADLYYTRYQVAVYLRTDLLYAGTARLADCREQVRQPLELLICDERNQDLEKIRRKVQAETGWLGVVVREEQVKDPEAVSRLHRIIVQHAVTDAPGEVVVLE